MKIFDELDKTMKMLDDAINSLNTLIDFTKIDNVEFDGIDHADYPDYCDAHITYAELHGLPLSEKELDYINDDRDLVYDKLMQKLF